MNYILEKVTLDKKEVLHNLLQFALYDGSKYIKNELNMLILSINGLTIILLIMIEKHIL